MNFKSYILLFIFIVISISGFTQKVNWVSWEDASKKAGDENKIIMVDIVSDNCKFCLRMDKETFVNEEIVKELNENYYSVKINSDRTDATFLVNDKEYTMNQMLNYLTNNSPMSDAKPKIAFPTIVFIFPADNTMYYETGYQEPSIFKFMLENCVKTKEKIEKKLQKKKK